jgi:osmoprotectant transport system substrate-binding protein
MKKKSATIITLLIVLSLSAAILIAYTFSLWKKDKASIAENLSSSMKPVITIGSKSFTEQYLLTKMTGILLRENGFAVKEIIFKGSMSIRSAIEAGVIDQYWDYPNTAIPFYHHKSVIIDANEAFRTVAEEDKKIGLHWLPMTTEINNTWTLLIKKDLKEQYGIKTISDLSKYAKEHKPLNMATNSEFLIRGDGMEQFQKVYHIDIPRENIIVSDTKLFAQAVKESRVQAAVGFASDGRIKAYGLVELEDDRHFFPPYNPAPVVTARIVNQHPQVETLLTGLSQKIDHDKFMSFLYKADVLHEDVTELARQYLIDSGLIKKK